MNKEEHPIEYHPLQPFLPKNAKLLMLGSFPPPKNRWSMNFYYPNFNNDMWRIFGYIFFANKMHFVQSDRKAFDRDRLIAFLKEKGIAIYDSASAIRRLKDNASDLYLEVVQQTDIFALLKNIPCCKAIVTTGEKSTRTLCETLKTEVPNVGGKSSFTIDNKEMYLYRMPSSSRAYPLALEKKAEHYKRMFTDLDMI
jgi:G:T/U-mismatch repair DNA glycosylase